MAVDTSVETSVTPASVTPASVTPASVTPASVPAVAGFEAALVDVAVQGARMRATADATELAAIGQLVMSRRATAREGLLAWRREHPDARAARTPWDVALAECEESVTGEVTDEVGAALRMSQRSARARVDLAVDLLTVTPRTWAALRDGTIDVARARRIVEALTPVHASDPAAAARVEQALLDRAGDQTPAQVAALARRLVLKAFPDAAREARAKAHADRRCGVQHGDDPSGRDAGQASFWVTGRADRVQAAFDHLTTTAHTYRAEHPDDPRTLDQVRADLALSALLGQITTGAGWTAPPAPPVTVHLVLPLAALQGGTEPADLLGHGPIPTGLALDLLTHPVTGHLRDDVTFTKWLVTDDGVVTTTGSTTYRRSYRPSAAVDRTVRARDTTCRFPGCRARAHGSATGHRRPDLDHVIPWPTGDTDPDNLIVLCRRHHNLKTKGTWTPVLDPHTGTVTWTSPTGHMSTTHPPQWPTGP